MYTSEDKLFYILIALLVIVGGIVGYFIFSMIRMHRHALHQRDLQEQARIIALEKERQLMAADLHDDIGPILSATMFKLGEVQPVKQDQHRLLKEAIGHIDNVFMRVRQLSLMLVPPGLERSGPLHAIENFHSIYTQSYPLKVTVNTIKCKELSGEKSLHLYRMLQEILHNTIRHAKANRLNISGEVDNNKLIIRTYDDGIGFNSNEGNEFKGVGLENISIRAAIIGAEVARESTRLAGTKYTIKVSLAS